MQKITFHKMHGLGNDFMIILNQKIDPKHIPALANRHTGIGFDQALIFNDNYVTIYNANGSVATFCGNGFRCLTHLLLNAHDIDNNDREKYSTQLHTQKQSSHSLVPNHQQQQQPDHAKHISTQLHNSKNNNAQQQATDTHMQYIHEDALKESNIHPTSHQMSMHTQHQNNSNSHTHCTTAYHNTAIHQHESDHLYNNIAQQHVSDNNISSPHSASIKFNTASGTIFGYIKDDQTATIRFPKSPIVKKFFFEDIGTVFHVDIGNEHMVCLNENNFDLAQLHTRCCEYTTYDINVFQVLHYDHTSATILCYERGAGPTLACGSGATAVASALSPLSSLTPYIIKMPGGNVEILSKKYHNHLTMWQTGPIYYSYQGSFIMS